MKRGTHIVILSILSGVLPITHAVAAQPYPEKPVRLIVPFAPRGTSDVVARIIAERLASFYPTRSSRVCPSSRGRWEFPASARERDRRAHASCR